MNKATNQMFVLGEKVYVVSIECGVWSTLVTRTCVTAGSA
jgi:hypothetical protein